MGCTEQGDEYGPEPVMYGPAPGEFYLKPMLADSNYVASLAEIQEVWVGEYQGWDENQQKVTKVRRKLTIQPNFMYTNIIQGVLVETGKSDYVDFERETGTYFYNTRTKTVTYTVKSDSLLNYGDEVFFGFNGKKYYDHTAGSYTEEVLFSVEHDGMRSWITKDSYLQSLTGTTLVYHMDIYRGEVDKQ